MLYPMHFNIHMKPLGEVFQRFWLSCPQYVDGTQLSHVHPTHPREAVEIMNKSLEVVLGCMRASKLKLDADKMEVLFVMGRSYPGNERIPWSCTTLN